MQPLTITRTEHHRPPRHLFAWLAAAVAIIAVAIALRGVLGDPPRADLNFTNSTKWAVHVDLIVDHGNSRIGLGTVGANKTLDVQEVAQPTGHDWTFEFSSWRHTARATISKADLRANQFRVGLPPSLVQELEAANPPPSPF